MPEIKITAPDNADLTIVSRNTFSGADGQVTTVDAGKEATIAVDSQNQVVISVGAVDGEVTSATPHVAQVVTEPEPEVELVDATDDQLLDIFSTLHADPATPRTTGGYITTDAANAALAAKGLKPINAVRRNEVSETGSFVKVPV